MTEEKRNAEPHKCIGQYGKPCLKCGATVEPNNVKNAIAVLKLLEGIPREFREARDTLIRSVEVDDSELRLQRITTIAERMEESLNENGGDASWLEEIGYILAFSRKEVRPDELEAS